MANMMDLKRRLIQQKLAETQQPQAQAIQIPQMPMRTPGEGLARFGAILAGQQPPSAENNPYIKAMVEAQAKNLYQDPSERLIKANQAVTGSPEFELKKAQVMANVRGQEALELERVKRDEAAKRYQQAIHDEGGQLGQITPNGIREYDANVGAVVTKPLPASIETRKQKAVEGLYDTVNQANTKYNQIQQGESAAQRLPQGFLGGAQIKWMNFIGSKDPSLADWQNLKSLLTNAQLQYTAKTKGAISDREMALFSQAAANDDIPNVMRQTKVLQAFKRAVFADQEAKLNSFKRSFNEDPRTWADLQVTNPYPEDQGGQVGPQQTQDPLESRKNFLRSKYVHPGR